MPCGLVRIGFEICVEICRRSNGQHIIMGLRFLTNVCLVVTSKSHGLGCTQLGGRRGIFSGIFSHKVIIYGGYVGFDRFFSPLLG